MKKVFPWFRKGGLFLSLLVPAAAGAAAQGGDVLLPIVGRIQPWSYSSPALDNPTGKTLPVLEKVFRKAGASFLQLEFREVVLGRGSFLEVSSLQDGASERLDARILETYGPYSSFFNGDAVKVRLFAGPHTKGNRFGVKTLGWGLPGGTATPVPATLCGPDNRVLSRDRRVARALLRMSNYYSVGTAWLINKKNCFVTAGHVLGAKSLTTLNVQFNVPLSSSSGGMRFPSPKDQYTWAGFTQRAFQVGGPGMDWGVFLTLKNVYTGKYPGEVQGDYFRIGGYPGAGAKLRVTGYGTDSTPRSYNLVQQTGTGPLAGISGSAIRYRVDTMGGNSGSPVIMAATGMAVGIHTHGGCTWSGGYNTGTFFTYGPFAAAVKKFTGTSRAGAYKVFGQGCKGPAGVPLLVPGGVPVLGRTFRVDLFYLAPKTPAFLLTGSSMARWGRAKLPLDLSFYGAKGCSLLVGPELLSARTIGPFGGAYVRFVIPKLPVLVGARFYQQWLVGDPKANPLGLIVSPGGAALVGKP